MSYGAITDIGSVREDVSPILSEEEIGSQWQKVRSKVIWRYAWSFLLPGGIILLALNITALVLTGIVSYHAAVDKTDLCKITDAGQPVCQAMWSLWIVSAAWYLGYLAVAIIAYLMASDGAPDNDNDDTEAILGGYLCLVVVYPFIVFVLIGALIVVMFLVFAAKDGNSDCNCNGCSDCGSCGGGCFICWCPTPSIGTPEDDCVPCCCWSTPSVGTHEDQQRMNVTEKEETPSIAKRLLGCWHRCLFCETVTV